MVNPRRPSFQRRTRTAISPSMTAPHVVRSTPTGMAFARCCIAACVSKSYSTGAAYAASRWPGSPSIAHALAAKAAVAGGTPSDATWGAPLTDVQIAQDFLAYERPLDIFGQMNGARRVPFETAVVSELAASGFVGAWRGAGRPVPVRRGAFDTTSLPHYYASQIVVFPAELLRSASPAAEPAVRDMLAQSVAAFTSSQALAPTNSGEANVSPPSFTASAPEITSTGATAAQKSADLLSLFGAVRKDLIAPVLIMTRRTAISYASTLTSGGSLMFPTITAIGGTLMGVPVIVTSAVPEVGSPTDNFVVLLDASAVLLADDGRIDFALAEAGSLQLDDAPTNRADTGAASTMTSLFQTRSAAVRIDREIAWGLAQADCCAWMAVQF